MTYHFTIIDETMTKKTWPPMAEVIERWRRNDKPYTE